MIIIIMSYKFLLLAVNIRIQLQYLDIDSIEVYWIFIGERH